jgi:ribosomal 50S subunit-recycling heat shock protein
MRLDKFLKVSRLIKRRTLANKVADAGQIWVNGKTAKPSLHLKPGDEILLLFGQTHRLLVKVLIVPTTKAVPVDVAPTLYTILTEDVA